MSKNNYTNIIGIVSGVSLFIGFTAGYLTNKYVDSVEKEKPLDNCDDSVEKEKPIAKLFLYPCPHMNPPHSPPPVHDTSKQEQIYNTFCSFSDDENTPISV